MNTAEMPARPLSVVPELLAPAGDWEALRAAVANGADAVYFGLSNFNARHRATNFTLEELPEVVGHLHAHNTRGYVTLNTLIFPDELAEAARFVAAVAEAGVDAVIVQDLGLVRLIKAVAPTLAVHGSTQMTLTEPRGIGFVRRMGVERVVLARELSVADIGKVRAGTDVPVEVFIHGALCVSYSGQCLTSEALGGRSANRGQCAQACRLPYALIVDGAERDLGDKAYLLSPQDLAGHELVGELSRIGVRSLKIEGRLKSAHYVAATCQTYRAALDETAAGRAFRIAKQQKLDLEQSFSRGFSHGFLSGVNHQVLVQGRFPKSRGVRAGTVAGVTREGVLVRTEGLAQLRPGDGVVLDEGHPEQDEMGGRVYDVRPPRNSELRPEHGSPRGLVEVLFGRADVNLAAVPIGAIVWKTDDPAMRKRLGQSFNRDVHVRRVLLSAHVVARLGRSLELTLTDPEGRSATAIWDTPLEPARKFPVTEPMLREQLGRMGDTPFDLGALTGELDEAMVPKSVLNDLRRRAVDELLLLRRRVSEVRDPAEALAALHARDAAEFAIGAVPVSDAAPVLTVLVRSPEQLSAVAEWSAENPADRPVMVYADFEDVRRYKDAVPAGRAAGLPIALATVRVIKPDEEGFLRQVAECDPDAVLVRNLGGIEFYSRQYPSLPLIGDYTLNVANELTAAELLRTGLRRLVPSYDLNWRQLEALLRRFPAATFETVIHQHIPMFHMEHCVFAHTLSDGADYRTCGRPCESHRVSLRDRQGVDHALVADAGCRNTLFNSAAQSAAEFVPRMKELGLRTFRVEMLREDAAQARLLLDRYTRVLRGQEDGRTTWKQLRVLNQLGVTRGTLDHE